MIKNVNFLTNPAYLDDYPQTFSYGFYITLLINFNKITAYLVFGTNYCF